MPCCGCIENHFPNIEKYLLYRKSEGEASQERRSGNPDQEGNQQRSRPLAATATDFRPRPESQIPFHPAQRAQQRAHVQPAQSSPMSPSRSPGYGSAYYQPRNHQSSYMFMGPHWLRSPIRESFQIQNYYANPLVAPAPPLHPVQSRHVSPGDLPGPPCTNLQPGHGGNNRYRNQGWPRNGRGGDGSQPR